MTKSTSILFVTIITLLLIVSCGAPKTSSSGSKTPTDSSYSQALIDCKGDKYASCLEGYAIPDFEATTIDGVKISTASLKGKPSIINFWFIGCPPCEAEIPGLNVLADKYASQGVQFIAIGRNAEEKLDPFFAKKPWRFEHINDPGQEITKGIFEFQYGFPTTLIVDGEGIIRKAFSGGAIGPEAGEVIQGKIEPMLKELLGS